MCYFTVSTFSLDESGFSNVFGRNANILAAFNILNAAFSHSIRYGLFYLYAADEPLPVHRTFVFTIHRPSMKWTIALIFIH